MRRVLTALLLVLLAGAFSAFAQEPADDCSVDLDEVKDLLQQAQSALDEGNTARAINRLREARDSLDDLIAVCDRADGVPLDESTTLRGTLPDGDIVLSYPQGWQAELSEDEIILREDAEADAITGVLTAFPFNALQAFDLSEDSSTAEMLEALALGMADSMDESALEPATTSGETTLVDGTVTEDGAVLRITFAAARFETGLAFLFLASPAADADVHTYTEAMIAALEFVPDE